MRYIKVATAIIIVLSFSISLTIQLFKASENKAHEAREQYLTANHIYDSIQQEVGTLITISKTMSVNSLLHEKLRNETSIPEAEIEKAFSNYLKIIKERFNYKAAYIISEQTHRYYTSKGIEKIVNPQLDPYDIWYQLFLESGKEYDLDTDRDQANDYLWTVFINFRITDENGKMLGVTGVGVTMSALQKMVEQFEEDYKYRINLVDLDGLVQVDTDSNNIENAYISDVIHDKAGKDSFTYAQRGLKGFRMTRYMESLEWFLVIQGTNALSTSYLTIILRHVLICIIMLSSYFYVIHRIGLRDQQNSFQNYSEDELTGLPNRNYFKEAYGELGILNTTRYKSIVIFDIDKFKSINDNRDGDQIIRSVTELSKEAIGNQGLLFRWGGDEFVVLLEMTDDEAAETFTTLCRRIKEKLSITISVGISKINLSDRIKTNYYRAAQMCYIVKEAGGNGVRKS